ncbi:GNAT family N-acetyltransferase [Roseibium porphyridii]|uniref:GNAT family N-acetyltransferase n=1 Tax=Roseibium porphyridii TaxID=2866279 RepID=A0ABY8F1U2_9HYPH|nr:GNAT family N-acetyltransferase [Roseibium sp. KMA01]WFE87977.1 GNAT family N-acetyltransferase [Roseibium sp. KMA01]
MAFSDYVVPLHMSIEKFTDFQKQRGFSSRHSFVARTDGEIAAFWYSAAPNPDWGGSAYTLSVGTHPQYRRSGLFGQLLKVVSGQLAADGATGMQLEVITSNDKAVAAYENAGFQASRGLRVCKLPKDGLERSSAEWGLQPIEIGELPSDETAYFDWQPTPQNSKNALIALAGKINAIAARSGGEILGWVAVYHDGSVAQIAVRKDHRRKGIGSALLAAAAESVDGEQLVFVNVDKSDMSTNALLDRFEAEDILEQQEMRLTF